MGVFAPMVVPTIILLAGVVDDIRSRKVHNELVIAAALVALVYSFYYAGLAGVQSGLLGMASAVVMTLPLVLFRIIGAGDLKLFMAFGLATSWEVVLSVGVSSLIWGAVLGLFRAALGGELMSLLKNTAGLLSKRPVPAPSDFHRIPYTVALFMGWMTYIATTVRGG